MTSIPIYSNIKLKPPTPKRCPPQPLQKKNACAKKLLVGCQGPKYHQAVKEIKNNGVKNVYMYVCKYVT
jgi:hypothetical protein